ncbi:ABC-TYPE TRANSPORTER, ATPASE COMPONENT [hydrothermal vent metagenome]|uniref:ABC-TYPE TRANSPORTER, ATPASE COMPONENT n=1 Tax=hydrothermal vent metagenome TaxID=652676 RepID=A0A1W1BZN7_9ZZZZ
MITLKNITKIYEINRDNSVTALDNVTLHIKEGELVVLKGVSGSGKSTILSLIASLTKPTTGEVIVNEKRVSKLPDNFASDYRQEDIGFIFQKYNLIPTLSVQDNILLPLVPTNPNEEEAKEKLYRVMRQFNIAHKQDTIVRNLSGGEQQRVAIARAHVNDPKIIIADEPTANLDEKLSLDFIEMLGGLKESGKTIVVATHDPLFFDLDIVDRVVEVQGGKIL